jgi:hypothetical protein
MRERARVVLETRGTLADRPVLGRKRGAEMGRDTNYASLYDLGKVRDTRSFAVDR